MNDYTNKTTRQAGGTLGTSINANDYGYYTNGYCQHRLPCGYCTMLNRVCPMQNNQVTYTTAHNGLTINPAVQTQLVNTDSAVGGTVINRNTDGVRIIPNG